MLQCNSSSSFVNKEEMLYDRGCKFKAEDFEISAHSIHFCFSKLLSVLIKTAFFNCRDRYSYTTWQNIKLIHKSN